VLAVRSPSPTPNGIMDLMNRKRPPKRCLVIEVDMRIFHWSKSKGFGNNYIENVVSNGLRGRIDERFRGQSIY